MAEENKHPPTTEEQAPPEMPRKAPKMEQAEIPDVGAGPAPSAKVIDLSAVRSTPEKDAPTDILKEPEAQPVSVTEYSKQEWKKPMPEPEKPKPKRGRPAKAEKATPTEPGAKKEVKAEKPRRGRPPKTEKASPEQAKPPKAGKTHAAPEEKAAPPAPEVPPTPRDATRAEKEEIVYLDLSDLHPFKDHPFGVRDDAEMKSLVESVRNGGVNQPALVRPREGGGYEIIAGHRRQMASQLAGYRNMPCIVRNMTDDEAILAMTDDNLRQRETILPSEKAMSLKMQYYGMNALSHNVIMADRKKLKSANGLYLGSTGSGKSFAAKRELLNVFLAIPQDRIIVVDPMGEYAPLVERLGGQVIEIAPDSPNHISPMDVQMDMGSGDSPLSLKADFLLSLCELVVGGRDGLQPIEKTVIDRCVRQVYREMALGLETAKTPLLQDLYEELLRQPEPEAKRIATALELYCTGSLNLFNHPTNVNLNSRVVCFVLKSMGENLRKIAMHITNDFVTSAVGTNFKNGVATWCYFDEFHILLRDPLTASYFVTVWKMLRKQGCVPSALTQNVKDLLASREIENILDNTDFMILLSQAQSDRTILAKQIGISEHQLSYITQSNSGEGLLFYGSVTIPFVDRFPRGEIYDLLTTKPEDAANGKQAE